MIRLQRQVQSQRRYIKDNLLQGDCTPSDEERAEDLPLRRSFQVPISFHTTLS